MQRNMPKSPLQRIREAVLSHRYVLTEHAYNEMTADGLDVLDLESAILTGRIQKSFSRDPRGKRYLVVGKACDEAAKVAVVARFVEGDQLLVITAYEVEPD